MSQSELHYPELTSADLGHLTLHPPYRKYSGISVCSWAMKALVFEVCALLIKMEKVSPAHLSTNGTWISSISKSHRACTQHTFQNQNCRDYSDRILAPTETLKLNKWKTTLTTAFPNGCTHSLEQHNQIIGISLFMPEREKFSYQRNRNWSTTLIFPTQKYYLIQSSP